MSAFDQQRAAGSRVCIGFFSALLCLTGGAEAWAKSGPCQSNEKPVIHSMTAEQSKPYAGETVHIVSDVTDDDSAIASYEWKANGTQWEAGGPEWTYTVPADANAGEKINIHLKVRDACGKVAQEHLKLDVVASDDDAVESYPEDDEAELFALRRPARKSIRTTLGSSLTGPHPEMGPVIDWRIDSPERRAELQRTYARRLRGPQDDAERGQDQ